MKFKSTLDEAPEEPADIPAEEVTALAIFQPEQTEEVMAEAKPAADTEEPAAETTETAEDTEADKEFGRIKISYNVTLAQFLRYARQQCEKKCHSAEYITTKNLRRKLASCQTSEGYTRYYYSDELEEYEETKLHRYDWTVNGTDSPCEAETMRSFAYDHQIYILNWDGSMYNEICEFTFDDEKTGHGYYFQAHRDAEQ